LEFLEKSINITNKWIIISDLERNFVSSLIYKQIICQFFKNKLTINDGYLSIKRSFTYEEWLEIFKKLNINEKYFKIIRCPYFKLIIIINVYLLKNI
jgi:hypothetical protein